MCNTCSLFCLVQNYFSLPTLHFPFRLSLTLQAVKTTDVNCIHSFENFNFLYIDRLLDQEYISNHFLNQLKLLSEILFLLK